MCVVYCLRIGAVGSRFGGATIVVSVGSSFFSLLKSALSNEPLEFVTKYFVIFSSLLK